MGYEEFSTAMTSRSLRTIKTELEFLTDSGHITTAQFNSILSQLPAQPYSVAENASVPIQSPSAINTRGGSTTNTTTPVFPALPLRNQTPVTATPPPPAAASPAPAPAPAPTNEKVGYYAHDPTPPPPAYASTPPAPPVLAHATALYAYAPTDAGDLALTAGEPVHVTEYMNAEWWKGRSVRTGAEGIFPRAYVRVDNNAPPAPAQGPMSYGNMPLAVAQGGPAAPGPNGEVVQQDGKAGKGQEMGKKFGKKLGNAAIFGAGATIGGNIVNGIF
ncbi:uncharacterized protein K452DRAFT_353005 [Aplosporella prunicola CBS 121167]|uniref:SH3 domain-containing protein n=1 Tax=Aplosporella prunicola CBS 121167 TaxID=1176127 RepID=A0A6A6B4A2_9PEZI|nr:uncharacterized protein K452DRAFT_353005 [Aplosporella prunicola CBS 121167]KAF2138458.1 hypothetical protein K452DRAFT_353005 [Aplosporella prunicola CBS 121167]